MGQHRRYVPLALACAIVLSVTACGDRESAKETAGSLSADDARVIPDALSIPTVLEAGKDFEVHFDESTDRGIHYLLHEVDGQEWLPRYQLTTAYSGESPGDRPEWYPYDPERAGISLGKTGRGPDLLTVPPRAEEGDYVLCTEVGSPREWLCAHTRVTQP